MGALGPKHILFGYMDPEGPLTPTVKNVGSVNLGGSKSLEYAHYTKEQ